MKVIVCGSRYYRDRARIEERLLQLVRSVGAVQIITGGARGADTLAHEIARQMQDDGRNVTTIVIRGHWQVKEDTPPWAIRTTPDGRRYDVRAGHERNGWMLDERPELVIAFADDLSEAPGTKDCLEQARRRGIATERHHRGGVERTSGAHPGLF
jgi:YspA, cpYpsA-related SLOG family